MDSHSRTIKVKTVAGEVRTFSLPAAAKVSQLKEQISEFFRVKLDSQCLIFHGKLLMDELSVSDYLKEDNLSLCMMARCAERSLTPPYLDPAEILKEAIENLEDIDDSTEEVELETSTPLYPDRQVSSEESGEEEDEVDDSDLSEEDIQNVMLHCAVSRARAIRALRENNNDLIDAILNFT